MPPHNKNLKITVDALFPNKSEEKAKEMIAEMISTIHQCLKLSLTEIFHDDTNEFTPLYDEHSRAEYFKAIEWIQEICTEGPTDEVLDKYHTLNKNYRDILFEFYQYFSRGLANSVFLMRAHITTELHGALLNYFARCTLFLIISKHYKTINIQRLKQENFIKLGPLSQAWFDHALITLNETELGLSNNGCPQLKEILCACGSVVLNAGMVALVISWIMGTSYNCLSHKTYMSTIPEAMRNLIENIINKKGESLNDYCIQYYDDGSASFHKNTAWIDLYYQIASFTSAIFPITLINFFLAKFNLGLNNVLRTGKKLFGTGKSSSVLTYARQQIDPGYLNKIKSTSSQASSCDDDSTAAHECRLKIN